MDDQARRRSVNAAPIMVRASITADEWERLRIAALKENRPAKDLVGDAIRAYLRTKGKR